MSGFSGLRRCALPVLLAAAAWPAGAAVVPLGVVFAGEPIPVALPLANEGTQERFFFEGVADCPCFQVRADPVVVPAGGRHEIGGVFQSRDTGRFSIQVRLQGAAGDEVLAVHTVTGVVAERSWLIRVPELLGLAAEGGAVLVDVRPAVQFARVHIPRSVNQPVFALAAAAQWKARTVVLVDEGSSPAELLEAARGLRGAGYREVRVLDGGLAAWARNGGALEGVEVLPVEVAQILPAQFERSRRSAEWRIIEMSGDAAAVSAELTQLPAVQPGRLPPRVLVVGSESDYAETERRCGALNVSRLFYLKGGPAALHEFRANQAAMAAGPGVGVLANRRGSELPHVSSCVPCRH